MFAVIGPDENGDVLLRPQTWQSKDPPPPIFLAGERPGGSAPGPGDLLLARVTPGGDGSYQATIMRRIAARPSSFLAVLGEDGCLHETEKKRGGRFYSVAPGEHDDVRPGDLVRARLEPGNRRSAGEARIIERLGPGEGAAGYSAMVIAGHDLPQIFDPAALDQAAAAEAVGLGDRVDLRHLALVTIDDHDARDFDDAVWAEPDPAADNPGGWHMVVAIADVAWYVRPGDALDRCALERGNSVYLPGCVLPMLPEALSNHWCSLKPGEDRPCLAVHLWIDGEGRALDHRFERALIRSTARLTYDQVQDARDGRPTEQTAALLETVITPLYGAYQALKAEAARRKPLAIELAERKPVLDQDGRVTGLEIRSHHSSHRLIEAFMIAANVAAARTLEELDLPCMYRLHEAPPLDKQEAFRQFIAGTGLRFPRSGQLMPDHFNRCLEKAKARGEGELLTDMILRSQSVAHYGPRRLGHFGLALASYAHFTSPIRRYADLLVHRALIAGLGAGEGGRAAGMDELDEIGASLSETERRAVSAEREVIDRIAVSLLSDRVGASFPGRVSGVSRAGLFIALDGLGADGLLPMSRLPGGRYHFDARQRLLRAGRSGPEFRLGDRLQVRIAQVSPVSGSLILELPD